MYVMTTGLVARLGTIHRKGTVWGLDGLLLGNSLAEFNETTALTYVETLALRRKNLNALLTRHFDDQQALHKAYLRETFKAAGRVVMRHIKKMHRETRLRKMGY